ncbi:MAG TPA: hypothetical protein PLO65_16700 [Caulobacter sp.]|nr:hypothetical protein [Caulobacter sp.]
MVKPRDARPRPVPLTPEEAAALDAAYDDLQARLDRYWALRRPADSADAIDRARGPGEEDGLAAGRRS